MDTNLRQTRGLATVSGMSHGAWWRLAAFGATLFAAGSPLRAATITDIPDAADTIVLGDKEHFDPFDIWVGADFEFAWYQGRITREPVNHPGVVVPGCDPANFRLCLPVQEMAFSRSWQMMNVRAEIGIFHDWAITLNLPIYFNMEDTIGYAPGVSGTNSTLDPSSGNTLIADGSTAKRSGLGALELGMRVAPLSDIRDDSKPTWVLYFSWGIPFTAEVWDPSTMPATATAPAPMGDGVHRLTFGTALSRRIGNFGLIGISHAEDRRGYTDPYIDISYTLPVPTGSHSPTPLVYNSQNNPFGMSPSHVGRVRAGMEVVPYEKLSAGHRVAFDFAFRGQFFSEGRNYSIITAPLGELTFTEQYFDVGGEVGLVVEIASYIRFQVAFGLSYLSEYFLTHENAGEDRTGDGQVTGPPDLLNPYYDATLDQVGFRLKSEEQILMRLTTGLLVTF